MNRPVGFAAGTPPGGQNAGEGSLQNVPGRRCFSPGCRRPPTRRAFFNEGQLAFEQTGLLLQPLPLDGRVGCHGWCGKSRTGQGGVDPVAVAAAATGKTPIPGETAAAESQAEAAARLAAGKPRLNVSRAEACPPPGHGAFAHRSCSISSWHVAPSIVMQGICPARIAFSRPGRGHRLRSDHQAGRSRGDRCGPPGCAQPVRPHLSVVAARPWWPWVADHQGERPAAACGSPA